MTAFITRLLDMSVAGAALILIVCALRGLLRRAPKWGVLLLWAAVGARLLCPLFISGGFGLIPSVADIGVKTAAELPAAQTQTSAPAQHAQRTGAAFMTELPGSTNEAASPVHSASPTQAAFTTQHDLSPAETAKAAVTEAAPAAPVAGATDEGSGSTSPKAPVPWQNIAFFVWLFGVVCFALYALISFARLRSRLSAAVRIRGNVFASEHANTPFLLGFIKPRIFVPFGLDGERLDFVLAHENAHLSRGDHVWKLIGFVALAVHWFDPFCWLGFVLFCRDIELACDERVTQNLTEAGRADYSEALLALSTGKSSLSPCPPAFGEGSVATRIKRVLSHKKPALWAALLCVLLALLLTGCSLFGGSNAEPSPEPEDITAEETPLPTESAPAAEEPDATPAPTEAPGETARPTLPLVLTFTDPAFEKCVRQQLDIPEGEPILRGQAQSLGRLIISSDEIMSLDDLDKFPAVTWITLKTADNADLSGLSMCTELQTLWINDGRLSDISFVSSLKKLDLFSFGGNGNVDLTPLAGLKNLRTLYISGCGAADLAPVAGLELTSLSISGMPGANFEVLRQMKDLDYLSIYDCDLTSIGFVSGLYALHTLVIGSNYITDLKPLTLIDSLEHLDAENNFISDISVLFKLPLLYDVELSWNPVDTADIDALREAIKDHGPAYGDPPQHDNHVYAYPYDRDKLACWPIDLDGDGEDEYFYADLNLLTGDFISYVWLENKDHHRLGYQMQCGTGHVAFASFALVESPEYGACIMKTEPIFGGSDYAYSLMTLVDGRFETVYSETFYNSDFEIGMPFDPAEAKAYEERVNALYASGRLLITTDRWGGMIDQEFICTSPETPVTPNHGDIAAVICAFGSTGPGLEWLAGSEYAKNFIIYYKPAYSKVTVEPFTGE